MVSSFASGGGADFIQRISHVSDQVSIFIFYLDTMRYLRYRKDMKTATKEQIKKEATGMFTVIPGYRVEWFVCGEWAFAPSAYTYPTRAEALASLPGHRIALPESSPLKNPAMWRIRKVK